MLYITMFLFLMFQLHRGYILIIHFLQVGVVLLTGKLEIGKLTQFRKPRPL